MEYEVKCNNCDWEGYENDLEIFEDEGGFFKGCPNCETDSYLMDIKTNQNADTNKPII